MHVDISVSEESPLEEVLQTCHILFQMLLSIRDALLCAKQGYLTQLEKKKEGNRAGKRNQNEMTQEKESSQIEKPEPPKNSEISENPEISETTEKPEDSKKSEKPCQKQAKKPNRQWYRIYVALIRKVHPDRSSGAADSFTYARIAWEEKDYVMLLSQVYASRCMCEELSSESMNEVLLQIHQYAKDINLALNCDIATCVSSEAFISKMENL
jgi:hypothetical protein